MLNQRQEQILLSLKKLGYLSRDQLQRLHSLGKTRNTNRVLQSLSQYVHTHREGYDTIYYLNKAGREYTGAKKVLRYTQFVPHVIMRNEFFLYAKPTEWKPEMKAKDGADSIVCDAWFMASQRYHFLEVDNKQKMSENKVKIQTYLRMNQRGILKKHFKYFPMLVWVTTSEHRKSQLLSLCEGLPVKVYTINDIKGSL